MSWAAGALTLSETTPADTTCRQTLATIPDLEKRRSRAHSEPGGCPNAIASGPVGKRSWIPAALTEVSNEVIRFVDQGELVPTMDVRNPQLNLRAVGIHALRHSAAAAMIGLGIGPKTIQRVLGHQSAAFTLTVYGHLFESDLDDLASRLDEAKPAQPAACTRPELPQERDAVLRSVI